jgi:hypothetical protein
VPARLRGKPFSQQVRRDGATWATGYSGLDPLVLSPDVMAILPYFQGQSTRAARQQIQRELGFDVEPELLRRLTDFGVLEDAT